jgi:hypothetical protein
MTDQNEQLKSDAVRAAEVPPDKKRRRLVGGGLGAAPLLMTLVSRPVLGQETCLSTSAHLSGPTSHPHEQQVCSGGSPSYWSRPQNFDEWPSPYQATTHGASAGTHGASAGLGSSSSLLSTTATLFSATFSPSPYPPETTLLTVLQMGGPSNDVARHLVAAQLNVAKGWTPVLDAGQIQAIWLEYTGKGYFEPTAGVKWYEPEIVAYLESLTTK